jgi:hypothetical protein
MSALDAWNYHMLKFEIIKKTRQRIYYLRRAIHVVERDYASGVRDLTDEGIAYINRQKIEQEGEIWSHKGGGWWEADCRLYLKPPPLPEWRREPEMPDLAKLKAAMAAAHPDRGGSNAAFIEARKRYIEARRRARVGV